MISDILTVVGIGDAFQFHAHLVFPGHYKQAEIAVVFWLVFF